MRCAASARGTASNSARPAPTDPLYESVSAGRRYPGMEHWLPFYYERLETLLRLSAGGRDLARLPGRGGSRPPPGGDRGFLCRAPQRHSRGAPAPGLSPIRPDQLYLDRREWQAALHGRSVVQLSPSRRIRATATPSMPAPPGAQLRGRARRPEYRRCSRRSATTSKPSANQAADRGRRVQSGLGDRPATSFRRRSSGTPFGCMCVLRSAIATSKICWLSVGSMYPTKRCDGGS